MPVNVEGTVNIAVELASGNVKASAGQSLKVDIGSFKYDIDGIQDVYAGAVAQSVTDDDTSYVYIDKDGVLQINITGYPTGQVHIPLAKVVAANGEIAKIYDERILFSTELDRKDSFDKSGGISSTTQTTWQQKVKLSVTGLPLGDYVLHWYAEIKHSNTTQSQYVEARLEVDDTQAGYMRHNNNWYLPFSGVLFAEAVSGDHAFDIDYQAQGGGTAYIRRARLYFRRIK